MGNRPHKEKSSSARSTSSEPTSPNKLTNNRKRCGSGALRSSLGNVFRRSTPTTAFRLNDQDLNYLCKQTELNAEAVKDIFNKFSEDNPSGYLDKAEFVRLYCSLRGEPPGKLRRIAEFAFTAFDADKNGPENVL